jgi:Protein of unknown function (DUF4038)/Putative collagen-binding domain of a collagenase
MIRLLLPLSICLFIPVLCLDADAAVHPLRVHPNHRYLQQADGQPFFYMGDTAWELLHRCNREEVDTYLSNRVRKGFTVIQTVILAELDGLNKPNALGDKPLIDNDPTRPNEAYFTFVDEVIQKAGSLGLTVGLLPTWGDKWHHRLTTPGPKVFTEANAFIFGKFVGKRYATSPIIWILGGDRNADSKEDLAVVRAMAKGLRAGGPKNLITFHPRGPGRSSDTFHNDDWLSFNTVQSSHAAKDFDNALFIDHDYKKSPAKPTLDAEPRYENLTTGFYIANANPAIRFDDVDVRQAAYWSLLAGAAGHTYGNSSVWQMSTPERDSVIGAVVPWQEALDHPGALQMGHMRKLFESRPFHLLVPDQKIVGPYYGPGAGFIRAARASDDSFAFIYTPLGQAVTVQLGGFKAPGGLKISWYDPRYGVSFPVMNADAVGVNAFVPPTSGRGQDWVLVIDNVDKKFPAPGKQWKAPASK